MKHFKTSNPPKKLRISEIRLPLKSTNFEILVPDPHNSLNMNVIRNFNKFSAGQLAKYKRVMFEDWGDLVLTLRYSDSYRAEYVPRYASNYRKRLSLSGLGISSWLQENGNLD